MRSPASLVAVAAAAAACGGESVTSTQVTVAGSYDVAGVGRVYPDGIAPESLLAIYLSLDGVQVAAGKAVGMVARKGGGAAAAFTGTFDTADRRLEVMALSAALTGTAAESIEQLGAVGLESRPIDGLADELSGFLRATRGRSAFDGTFLAVSRIAGRPARPDETKIRARAETTLGKARITGDAGAATPRVGIEVLAYGLRARDPQFTLGQAGADGSFEFAIDAYARDLLLVRATAVGMPSDARPVTVAP